MRMQSNAFDSFSVMLILIINYSIPVITIQALGLDFCCTS